MNKVTLEKGKKGFLTLKYENRYLHSSVNPEKEAERMLPSRLDSSIYIVFGLGLGYHIKALFEKLTHKNFHIFVFEDSQEILDAFKQAKLIEDSRIHIFLNKDFSEFTKFFMDKVPFHQIENPVFFDLKSEKALFEREYDQIKKDINIFMNYYFQSLFTEAEFGHLWYKNIISNSPYIFNSEFSLFMKGDAVLISAGPSLTDSLEQLKKLYKKVPFFAVDTALPTLLAKGIVPEVIIATDPQIHNYKDFFHSDEAKDSILACDISTYHKIPELFEKHFFFRTEGLGEDFFDSINSFDGISMPCFPPGGSVSSSALTLLHYLGAKRIILAGQDLCYPNLTHSIGGIHYNRVLYSSDRKNTIWNFFNNVIESRGHQDLFMKNLSLWIDDFIELTDTPIYQINPMHPLKNVKKINDTDFNGELISFKKLKRKSQKSLEDFWQVFLQILQELRDSKDSQEFMDIRFREEFFIPCFNKLFMKQDLYLNRNKGDSTLYLGGCFRIIDRLIRAIYYRNNKLKDDYFN